MTATPFPRLQPGDHARLPQNDGWGPVRHVTHVWHGIAHTRLPITTVWWKAASYEPDCAAFTGTDYARGFLYATSDDCTDQLRDALQASADGRST